jgi:choline dehydrogenase
MPPTTTLVTLAPHFPHHHLLNSTTVIGGGTAGLVIASRLSSFASVAVVEAGGLYEQDNGNASIVPWFGLLMPFLAQIDDYPRQRLMDWDLLAAAPGGRGIHYAQGKTLGGSSAINTQAYHRANKGAYQRWANLVGDQSYTFDNLLPFFKMSSTLLPPDLEKRNASNATVYYDPKAFDNRLNGPLQVSWANWVDPAQSWLVRALQAVGMNLSKEGFSSGTLNGGAWIPTTIDPERATRSTSKSSYLDPLIRKGASQPTIYLRSQASNILFDRHNRATGVVVTTMGRTYVLSAKKEIILSAGVFHSPQLLMLSGMLINCSSGISC